MNKENWSIEYSLALDSGIVLYVSEVFPAAEGYHKRVRDWLDAVKESAGEMSPHGDLERMMHPVYTMRWNAPEQGTYIKLITLTVEDSFRSDISTGMNLPLHPALQTARGKVLLSEQHPITLIAPDRTKYTATQI